MFTSRSGCRGQYIVLSEEGSGGNGIVHKCQTVIVNGDHLETREFVRKRMPISTFHEQEARVYIDYGAQLPRTLEFLGIVRNMNHVDMFLQYAAGGSLAQWIQRCPILETVDSVGRDIIYNQMISIIYHLLCCTSDFNKLKLAHCDIKAWNVLFTTKDCKGSSVVLADTGTTKVWQDVQHYGIHKLDGTVIFCSPECEEVYACPEDFLDLELCDAWEVGAIIYHILTRQYLWVEEKHRFRRIYAENWHKPMRNYIMSEGWRVCERINDIDQSQHRLISPLVMVLSCLLEYDASLRKTASEVLELPLFSGTRQNQIPSTATELEDPCDEVIFSIPQYTRPGKGRRFPENPYSKLVVMFGHTPIYIKYFKTIEGFHLHHLATNSEFQKQLELHVPNFENGYSLVCHTWDTIKRLFVLMNVGNIHQDTYVYLTTT
ncbi:uncharacterized protein LOC117330051 [Pecten maximus]|uniref:uncharacterized protein LOC117330051 n=1 Tax=Pecten maximus TaxID=6579 RepID=UPI00145800DF|nr:uncharacterized protein LOC117330051 [Pecten maximus]